MKTIGFIILAYGLVSIASLLFVGCLMFAFWVKFKCSHMDQEKWEVYFKNLSTFGYLTRCLLLYTIPLLLISYLGYHMYVYFQYDHPFLLAITTFFFGLVRIIHEILFHKAELLDKFRKIW